MAEEIDKNKGAWTDVTVEELRRYYTVRLMMDVVKLDRDVHYRNRDEEYFLLRTKIGKVMAKNRFFLDQTLPVFQ